MTVSAKGSPPGHGSDPLELSSYGRRVDSSESAPNTAPAQENLLLEAIKTLCAEEICADTLERVTLDLSASGWRAAALFMNHAANCVEAGDYLAAERHRQRAREQFVEANDVFRQFQEARAAEGASLWAEAFR